MAYDIKIRQAALKMHHDGKKISHIAKEFGITDKTVRSWIGKEIPGDHLTVTPIIKPDSHDQTAKIQAYKDQIENLINEIEDLTNENKALCEENREQQQMLVDAFSLILQLHRELRQ